MYIGRDDGGAEPTQIHDNCRGARLSATAKLRREIIKGEKNI